MVQLSKITATVVTVSVGIILFVRLTPSSKPYPGVPNKISTDVPKPALPTPSTRTVYPYSVIAGGVRSPAELRKALLHDPAAATHYAGFDLQATRLIRADRPRKVYVSYRIDQRIYWTRKRVQVPKGETLLTDGTNIARTRCGNQISETPHSQTNASEPTEAALDTETVQPATSLPVPLATQPANTTRRANTELLKSAPATAPTGDYLAQFGPSQFNGSQSSPSRGGPSGSLSGAASMAGAAGSGSTPTDSAIAEGGGIGLGTPSAFIPLQGSLESGLPNLLTVSPAFSIVPGNNIAAILPSQPQQIAQYPAIPHPGFLPGESAFPVALVPLGQYPASVTVPSSPASNPSFAFSTETVPLASAPERSIAKERILQISIDQNGPKSTAQGVQAPEPDTLLLTLGAALLLFSSYKMRKQS